MKKSKKNKERKMMKKKEEEEEEEKEKKKARYLQYCEFFFEFNSVFCWKLYSTTILSKDNNNMFRKIYRSEKKFSEKKSSEFLSLEKSFREISSGKMSWNRLSAIMSVCIVGWTFFSLLVTTCLEQELKMFQYRYALSCVEKFTVVLLPSSLD